MVDIRVLLIITLVIIGFGLIPLLGAILPRDLDDDEDE
jgi:hypothetical protein